MDAVVGMRDLLAAANRQKEDAFVNGLEAVIQAQKAQEARIAAQDEQIAFLKAQSNDGVEQRIADCERRLEERLPQITQAIEKRLGKVESSLGESFHALETLIASLSAGKRKALDLLVAQAVTAFSGSSVHMTDEQRVTFVQKRVRGFLRRRRVVNREDATAKTLAELAAFKETTKRELEEAARGRDAERDAADAARRRADAERDAERDATDAARRRTDDERDAKRDAADAARRADRDEERKERESAVQEGDQALQREREDLARDRDADARARDDEARRREEERAAAVREREEALARREAAATEREAAATGDAAEARAEAARARTESKAETEAEIERLRQEARDKDAAMQRTRAEAAAERVAALEREEKATRDAAQARAEAAAAKGASDELVNFLQQHPDLEKEVADDGAVEQRLIDFEKRSADAFFRLEQMIELRVAQSAELEKRIQAIASGEERIGGSSKRKPVNAVKAKEKVVAKAKRAAKEVEEFTTEFKNAARECFQLIDKDNGGSLSKAEIVEAVRSDRKVIRFLTTCGEDNLIFLLHPPRLAKALEVLDTDNSGEVDIDEWEEATDRGLAKRLDQLANERERREKAAAAEDENFSVEFLGAARKVFEMIDVDESGTLDKAEVVTAVRGNQKVIKFLVNCGEKNLQYLLVPARLDAALAAMDTDRDGSIDCDEWEKCIKLALENKLQQRAAKRELDDKKAAKQIEEFTHEFKNAARECFQLIDIDEGGSLSTSEIVRAVKEDRKVIAFLQTCGEDNLQFLLHPPRLKKALAILDTDASGEIDIDEWEEAINRGLAKRLEAMAKERERMKRAAEQADKEFSAEFLSAAREVFQMIDADESGTLEKAEVVRACAINEKVIAFLQDCGDANLQYLLVPARLEAALAQMDTDNDGSISSDEWADCIENALATKLEQRAVAHEVELQQTLKTVSVVAPIIEYDPLPEPVGEENAELREDVTKLTHFVDRLQIRCEDFFKQQAAEQAKANEDHVQERRVRLNCVDALQALRDGVGAARGVDGRTGSELESLDSVCRRTLAALPTRKTLLKDPEPRALKPSALLRLRMAAAALDRAVDATVEEPFALAGALNHAQRSQPRLQDANEDPYSTWHAPLASALDATCALLDRHASPSAGALDLLKVCPPKRKRRNPEETPCSNDEALAEWGRRMDKGLVPAARQWRVVSGLVDDDTEDTQPPVVQAVYEDVWTSDGEDTGVLKRDVVQAQTTAEAAQRACLRLDAALEEIVAQMRGGFASKGDLKEVEEHLRRLASIQRGTADEIAANRSGLSDYERELQRVADSVRASQAKTPRYDRLEQLILRKADAEAVARVTTEIRGRVDGVEIKAAEFVVPEPQMGDEVFSVRWMGGQRSYAPPQNAPEPVRQRSMGVMPPSASVDLDVAGTRAPVDRRQVRIATPPRGMRAQDMRLAMEAPDVFLAMQNRNKPLAKQPPKHMRAEVAARVAPPMGRHSVASRDEFPPGPGMY